MSDESWESAYWASVRREFEERLYADEMGDS